MWRRWREHQPGVRNRSCGCRLRGRDGRRGPAAASSERRRRSSREERGESVLAEGEMWCALCFRERFRSCDGRVVDGSDRILSRDLWYHILLTGDESTRRVWHWDHKLDLNFVLGINKSGPCLMLSTRVFSSSTRPINLQPTSS
jgi:hypothetical protein